PVATLFPYTTLFRSHRDPPPPPVRELRGALHHVRARAAARGDGDQKRRRRRGEAARAFRPGEDRAVGRPRLPQAQHRAGTDRPARLGNPAPGRDRGRNRNRLDADRGDGDGRAAPARFGRLHPFRLGLPRFLGSSRLRGIRELGARGGDGVGRGFPVFAPARAPALLPFPPFPFSVRPERSRGIAFERSRELLWWQNASASLGILPSTSLGTNGWGLGPDQSDQERSLRTRSGKRSTIPTCSGPTSCAAPTAAITPGTPRTSRIVSPNTSTAGFRATPTTAGP